MAGLEAAYDRRARPRGVWRSLPCAAFLGVECVDSSHHHRCLGNARKPAADGGRDDFCDRAERGANATTDFRYRRRDSGSPRHRCARSRRRLDASRKRATAWKSPGRLWRSYRRDLLHDWPTLAKIAGNLGICRNRVCHGVRRACADRALARDHYHTAAAEGDRYFRGPSAWTDVNRSYRHELGAQISTRLRRQSHCAWGASWRDAAGSPDSVYPTDPHAVDIARGRNRPWGHCRRSRKALSTEHPKRLIIKFYCGPLSCRAHPTTPSAHRQYDAKPEIRSATPVPPAGPSCNELGAEENCRASVKNHHVSPCRVRTQHWGRLLSGQLQSDDRLLAKARS